MLKFEKLFISNLRRKSHGLKNVSEIIVSAVIILIKFYQRYISLLFPKKCRFYPSCSSYAILALKKYGFFKGVFKTIYRILRCNPFSKGGVDYP